MKTTAIELLNWINCRPTITAVVERVIKNLGNKYTFTGQIDNVILDAIESVINKMNVNCDLRLDQETIYQKTWEFAANVVRDKYFVNNISGN